MSKPAKYKAEDQIPVPSKIRVVVPASASRSGAEHMVSIYACTLTVVPLKIPKTKAASHAVDPMRNEIRTDIAEYNRALFEPPTPVEPVPETD